jgi:hypothetical protein
MMRTPVMTFCLCTVLVGIAPAQDSLYFRRVGRWGSSQLTGVAVNGTYAYVVGLSDDLYNGLHVLSLADLEHPEEVWRCSVISAVPLGVTVSGHYVYVAEGTDGLRVFSIAEPAQPVEVGRCNTHAALSVNISGDYAYVTDTSGLSVISIADPSHPTEVAHLHSPGGWHDWYEAKAVGNYAYVAAGGGGLRVISIVDPTEPVEVGCYEPNVSVGGVALDGEYAYLACQNGFRVVSVADPTHPAEVGVLDSTGLTCWGMALTRGYAFTTGGTGAAMWAVAISDPAHPSLVGHYSHTSGWPALTIDGDYIFYGCFSGLRIFQFYQLGDLDIDNDSLDVVADTLRLRRWATGSGDSLECALGEFVLANTSTSYNPDSIDGPSVSPIDSLSFMGSLAGPGGTIDSILIPNLPASLGQGQTLVCTLAAYMPPGLRDGDYSGSIFLSGKDTAGLQVYESCYVFVRKLGDLDVDNDSLDVIADTMRLTNLGSEAIGEFILANTSASYNPDTSDGPSRSPIDSLSFTGSLTGQSGTIDSILVPNLPATLARGQAIVCTLAVYVPPELRDGDYAGSITITGKDSVGAPIQETFSALVKNVLGDLDVDGDSLDVVHDTMNVRVQPVYMPSGMARFMLVNTSSSYNPDAEDGPSHSPLREFRVEAKVEAQGSSIDSVYVLNLPESLAVGQAVECTLALVIQIGESLDNYFGMVTINALDTLAYQVRDSFFLVVRGPEPHQNLDSFWVAPIPFKPNQNPEHDAIHFQGLTAGARVIVYDASGQSVWSTTESGDGHLAWDAKVASGIYVYLVVAKDGASKVGKLSVIR